MASTESNKLESPMGYVSLGGSTKTGVFKIPRNLKYAKDNNEFSFSAIVYNYYSPHSNDLSDALIKNVASHLKQEYFDNRLMVKAFAEVAVKNKGKVPLLHLDSNQKVSLLNIDEHSIAEESYSPEELEKRLDKEFTFSYFTPIAGGFKREIKTGILKHVAQDYFTLETHIGYRNYSFKNVERFYLLRHNPKIFYERDFYCRVAVIFTKNKALIKAKSSMVKRSYDPVFDDVDKLSMMMAGLDAIKDKEVMKL